MRFDGIVLCGGQSVRMGQSKAWLPFAGERMLQRVVRLVEQAVASVTVVAAPGQELPSLPASVTVARDAEANLGPLQGLATGLTAVAERCDAVFLSACDAPFLRPEFIRFVCGQLDDALIAVPVADGRPHPLAAAYRIDVLPFALELLASNCRRMSLLFEACRTTFIPVEQLTTIDPDLRSLWNVNTPEDYQKALEREGEKTKGDRHIKGTGTFISTNTQN